MRCKNLILFDRNQQSVAGLGLIKRIAAVEEAVSINRQDVRDRPSALSQAVTVRSVFHTILIGELGGATLLAGRIGLPGLFQRSTERTNDGWPFADRGFAWVGIAVHLISRVPLRW
jgi:hypothetical protein